MSSRNGTRLQSSNVRITWQILPLKSGQSRYDDVLFRKRCSANNRFQPTGRFLQFSSVGWADAVTPTIRLSPAAKYVTARRNHPRHRQHCRPNPGSPRPFRCSRAHGVGPIHRRLTLPVLPRCVHVIALPRHVRIGANLMLPIAPLPDTAFAFCHPAWPGTRPCPAAWKTPLNHRRRIGSSASPGGKRQMACSAPARPPSPRLKKACAGLSP